MSILLRQATIVDPSSPFHLQKADIFVQQGVIKSIAKELTQDADQVIDTKNLYVSPGWVDVFAHFPDPGYEYKETLETGSLAAASGGYTDVFLLPNTTPCIHNKAGVEYIVQRTKIHPVNLHPIAAITRDTEGKDLAEMYDMGISGAVAYSDGLNSLQSPGVMLKALQYVQAVSKIIIQLPDDKSVNPAGLMNEGVVSTQLGLPGRPAIAEELMIARDIELLKYTGSKLHITGISTKKSVELIKKAKEDGLDISCSVTPYHIFFTENDLKSYDTNLKVNPPLRSEDDRAALRQAILDGTVDFIASHHIPQDNDSKVVEFEYARHGMIGLQTAFALIRTSLPELSIEKLVELFSSNARRIFDLNKGKIDVNNFASLTLFVPDQQISFEKTDNMSKSSNSPLFGKTLIGKPVGIINKERLFLS
ncbi:MAG TPA: dihydroorotase [Chitinophagaceae bacterium]